MILPDPTKFESYPKIFFGTDMVQLLNQNKLSLFMLKPLSDLNVLSQFTC